MNRPGTFFDLATAVFFFFFLLKLVSIGVRELGRERHERFKERPATWLQYSQLPLIVIMILLVCAGIWTDYFRGDVPAATGFLLRAAGMLLIAAGFSLAVWAVRTIGRDMQSDIAVNKGHVLRTEGAYSVVRHPMYLSLILLGLGAGLSTLNLLLTGFALLVLAPVQFLRARKEEHLFVKHFGKAYTGYQKKTPMIVPCLFR
ncbi:MAG: isoprenylcysteine carboxylmethyltransferase family protein [Nitrospirota bacterium]|nr:isoprenylcysteine carboxylmethyltransferase family protein [Nitrospirota bacterium]